VEGLRPVPKGNGFEFIEHPGIIRQMAQAAESGSPQILIIDEVNRANIPRVFGELMYLLEYRDERIHLQYGGEFKLPKNIYIIGTMNNADRSVRTIDLALRRRFDFFELAPNMQVLEAFYKSRRNELNEKLWTGLQKLNERIENELGVRHLAIGHSYFMKSDGMDKTQLSKIWKQQIFPLIEDYFYDQPEIAKSFRLQDFWE
jgi:5-methylcytosine-specific restriction endonuclease McrBC GTP-binding regulatory subunit McrB